MTPPGLLVAAPGSGSGKTTLSLLLAAWARGRGLDVRPFKCGPDFLDAQYLSLAAGAPAAALDPWFLAPEALRRHYHGRSAGGGLALAEGVMGLYDGKRGAPFGRYSSAEVAKTLGLPVVLVLDARRAGPTLATQALGLRRADPALDIAGVVLNRASGERAAAPLARALRRIAGVPTLGWLPELPGLRLEERHLGLTAPSEAGDWARALAAALPVAARTVDFAAVLRLARRARRWTAAGGALNRSGPRFRLAVARDAAFHFYYPENLDLWKGLGAELAFFSPLKDRALPSGSQGLLLGGGFPESFTRELSANLPLRREARARIRAGLPVWAECGGLMWLCSALVGLDGVRRPQVGALPAVARMTRRLQHFGYTRAVAPAGPAWPLGGARGFSLKGHEFHHSVLEFAGRSAPLWSLEQSGRPARPEGYRAGPRALATYFHAYLPSDPRAARAFAAACAGA